jgi:hypothetical protein
MNGEIKTIYLKTKNSREQEKVFNTQKRVGSNLKKCQTEVLWLKRKSRQKKKKL